MGFLSSHFVRLITVIVEDLQWNSGAKRNLTALNDIERGVYK
jgi:hypothetical protein